MDEKTSLLSKIEYDINNNNINDAIKKAFQGYSLYRDNCFLNKVVQIYEKNYEYKKAISVLKKMQKKEPDNLYITKKIAFNLFILKDFKKALKYYKAILEAEPFISENNYNLGCIYHYTKDYKNAEKFYSYALQADNQNISAINNLGDLYYETKNIDEAVKLFNMAISINPLHPEAYHHLGVINREIFKDYELSVLYLKKALRIHPNYILNSFQLAMTYKEMGETSKAVEFLNNCLKLNPNYKQAIKELKKLRN